MNSDNKIVTTVMDYVLLETEVRKKASEYLTDINEENIKKFAESTKLIALSVLENYFFNIDDFYSEGPFKISDETKLDRFSDFHDGYRVKMKEWSKENKIEIHQVDITSIENRPEMDHSIMIKPISTLAVGTIFATGLFIFTNVWVFVAAELLALSTSAYLYRKEKEHRKELYSFQLKQYEIQINNKRAELVNGLISDLKQWLKQAEVYSDSVLSKLGVKYNE